MQNVVRFYPSRHRDRLVSQRDQRSPHTPPPYLYQTPWGGNTFKKCKDDKKYIHIKSFYNQMQLHLIACRGRRSKHIRTYRQDYFNRKVFVKQLITSKCQEATDYKRMHVMCMSLIAWVLQRGRGWRKEWTERLSAIMLPISNSWFIAS